LICIIHWQYRSTGTGAYMYGYDNSATERPSNEAHANCYYKALLINATMVHMHVKKSYSNTNSQSNILAARRGAASFGENQTSAETQNWYLIACACVRKSICAYVRACVHASVCADGLREKKE